MSCDSVAYVALSEDQRCDRKDNPEYRKQRVPIMRFARHQRLRVRQTISEVLEKGPTNFYAQEGIERLLSIAGYQTYGGKPKVYCPTLVLVQNRSCFTAAPLELAVLLAHFRRAGISVLEAATGEDLTQNACLIEKVLNSATADSLRAVRRQLTNAKSRAARRRSGERPKRPGPKPFGTLPGEEKVRKVAQRLRRKPRKRRRMSYRRIAAILDSKGLPTRSGKPWEARTVQGILRRRLPSLD